MLIYKPNFLSVHFSIDEKRTKKSSLYIIFAKKQTKIIDHTYPDHFALWILFHPT